MKLNNSQSMGKKCPQTLWYKLWCGDVEIPVLSLRGHFIPSWLKEETDVNLFLRIYIYKRILQFYN
jgi:hypothetical protein